MNINDKIKGLSHKSLEDLIYLLNKPLNKSILLDRYLELREMVLEAIEEEYEEIDDMKDTYGHDMYDIERDKQLEEGF